LENVNDISATGLLILIKFGTVMCIGPPNPTGYQKFENPRWWDSRHLENKKSWYLHNHLTDFDEFCMVTHIWTHDLN